MGSNFTDYLREAHRVLKLDGALHIYEATSRFNDRDRFAHALADLGFSVFPVEDAWKFTHIHAQKNARVPTRDVPLRF
jgi:ubiquinone/menaquinone biosynthesis C-methylase UbiE